MISQNITLLAQQNEQLITETGLHRESDTAICMESNGLLALSRGANAALTLEVLQDDMSLNLPQAFQQSDGAIADVSHCLLESLENINEFLLQQAATGGVELGVVQLGKQHFSAWVSGDICAARFRGDNIELMCDETRQAPLVGMQNDFSPRLLELDFAAADILLLTTQKVIDALEADFVRLTLSRFNDNLHMALRQLNTRAQRNGLAGKPMLILCRIEQAQKTKGSGWFKRSK